MGKHVFATFSTWVTPTVAVARGEVWDSDDPVVQSHPDWFTDDPAVAGALRTSSPNPLPVVEQRVVEQTTADPGEKRTVSRPRGTQGESKP